jgi:adenylate cyclase
MEGSVSRPAATPVVETGTLSRLGVRGRLLLAFFGISTFAVLGAAAALYSFREIDKVLALITQQRIPVAVQSQDLSRHAERIAAAAPALLTITSQTEKDQWSRGIEIEVVTLNELLAQLKLAGVEGAAVQALEPNVERMRANLQNLDRLVNERLIVSDQKREVLRKAIQGTSALQGLLAPWISVMDERIAQWRRLAGDGTVPSERRTEADREFEKSLAWFRALQTSDVLASAIADLMQRAASTDDVSTVNITGFRLQQSLNELERLSTQFDPKLRSLMVAAIRDLRPFVMGSDSLPSLRRRELDLTVNGTKLLSENADLSKRMTETVASLVAGARKDIADANAEAISVARLSTWILIIAVVLSLVSSVLIVWLYVGRNLIARLTLLSDRMLTLAAGDLKAPLPKGGNDEIGQMAEALAVFRATAVEMEETNFREIREARTRLTEAIEAISEGFSLYDAEDRLVVCNNRYKELLFGHRDAIIPGAPFESIVRTAVDRGLIVDAKGQEEQWLAARLERRRSHSEPHIQRRSDGRWVRISERPTSTGGIVATYADITELKQREAELANILHEVEVARDAANEANRTKSSFLANMSHELRTPLNAIINVTEMLIEDARDFNRPDELEPLDRVLRAARHLLALINDILDLSKIEAGRMELHLDSFALAPLIEDVVKTIEPLAGKNGNELVLQCDPEVGTIQADQIRVRQALLNLVSNANKFTEKGTVTIRAHRRGESGRDFITIAVSDTGIGISAEQMGKLFQDFSQADSSATRKYGGTGLGLAISRRFCQMMGGDITVQSESGRGSTFTIRLPAIVGDPTVSLTAPEPIRTRVEGPSSLPAPLILIIDDDPTVRDMIGRLLEREGFKVAKADGGRQGLRMVRELRPAAVTLDVIMPDLDGWTVLAAIKGDPVLADTPVVLVTIIDEKNRGYSIGAADYLVKPFDRDKLIGTLRTLCDSIGGCVLIVDDDDIGRKQMREALEQHRWTIMEAENGRIGLERLREARPDAIILDLMMPEMEGFELLESLRSNPEWRDIPVVVVTARDLTAEDRRRLNGEVEKIILKSERDLMLRQVLGALTKCTGRWRSTMPAEV